MSSSIRSSWGSAARRARGSSDPSRPRTPRPADRPTPKCAQRRAVLRDGLREAQTELIDEPLHRLGRSRCPEPRRTPPAPRRLAPPARLQGPPPGTCVHHGAQNQNATSWPARSSPSIVPPPRRGAVNRSTSGTARPPGIAASRSAPRRRRRSGAPAERLDRACRTRSLGRTSTAKHDAESDERASWRPGRSRAGIGRGTSPDGTARCPRTGDAGGPGSVRRLQARLQRLHVQIGPRVTAGRSRSRVSASRFATAQLRYHLRSAGTTYQGAMSVEHSAIASSYAAR